MKHRMYTVFDAAVGAYLPPFFARAKGEAIRSFSDAVNSRDHQFNKYMNDYTLFEIGEFEDVDGSIIVPAVPTKVISAVECYQMEDIFPPEKKVS